MMESVFVQITGNTFHAHYLGIQSIEDCSYKRNEASLDTLPDFEALLLRSGFTVFSTEPRRNGALTIYSRDRFQLPEDAS